jgi:hypothetical protein
MITLASEREALTAAELRVLAAHARGRHPNLTDSDEVFIAFALGQEHPGCCASAEYVDDDWGYDPETQEPIDPPHLLRSHGVPIAVRIHGSVVFAARPARRGEPCLGRVMAHAGRAAVFVHALFADDQIASYDRADFAQLCERYGIQERP